MEGGGVERKRVERRQKKEEMDVGERVRKKGGGREKVLYQQVKPSCRSLVQITSQTLHGLCIF